MVEKLADCPNCGYAHQLKRTICKSCGVDMLEALIAPAVSDSDEILDPDERKRVLVEYIQLFTARGYHLVNQTETTAQMKKPKQFSLFISLLGLLLFVVGLFIYLLIYMAERDKTAFLSVDEFGQVTVTGQGYGNGTRRPHSKSGPPARSV